MGSRSEIRLGCALILTAAFLAPAAAANNDGIPESMFAFARQIETSLNACDTSLFDSSVDFDALLQRGTSDLEVPEDVRKEFAGGIARGFILGDEICKAVTHSGSYDLMRVARIDGEPRALYRVVSDGGLNYHDLLLSSADDGVKVIDMFVLSLGEWISQTARRGFLPLAAQLEQGPLESLEPGENVYLDNIPNVLRMQQRFQQGEFTQALEVYYALPEELRTNRNILMTRFAIAVQLGGEEYDAAMLDLKNTFPGDPGLDLVLIDHYFNEGRFDEALEIVDRIDRWAGGDPYLDFMRANILYAAGRSGPARAAARRAIEREPGLSEPYWTLVTISLGEKDFAETAKLLTEIESKLGVVLGDLSAIPDYSEFVRSDAYGAWSAERSVE